ncbi:probable multidrug resistance-associated protein lethal(2)03659 [Leptopilina heterotoma]|uniref:probable multidrug resistance-associated protein lethal(2)03659 n=1 Tax=Leptopilina heterotoma TaxID=63436 RepID=UPI001CA97E6A|nr:probable multidrug resistance-associated protein lethal(2)03659 [Leptopilina heterotoma]XP_043470091.1 probable multidrug resistance-associated protein lethal(2)03659 [Leptopilina heterotoma]XP_043470092.1 probable multidrug resistance-associated protein lethal(2)03659 [Leptopilina heterotoma]XP_043470094.1 probable multidrug resistance-associated protein lethal(2)03659 [Leptopilina heterotoma]
MDKNEKKEVKHPRENANIFSVLSFTWLYKIFFLGNKKELEVTDLYSPLKEHSSHRLGDKLLKIWKDEESKCEKNGKTKPNLIKVLARCFGMRILFIGCFQAFTELVVRICQPVFLAKLLTFFHTGDAFTNPEVFYWAAGLVLCLIIHCIIFNLALHGMTHMGMKIRVGCCTLVYRKILKLTKCTIDEETTVGQIINLLSNDVHSLDYALNDLHYFWISPIQAIIVAYIMYIEVQSAAIYGILILFLLIPLLVFIGLHVPKITIKSSFKTDDRLRLMNEIISGVQVIKMYAWEKPFSYLVDQIRAKEISAIRKCSFVDAVQMSFDSYIPRVCLFVTIITYALMGNPLSAHTVYIITSYYNNMRYSVNICLQFSVQRIAKAVAAVNRLENFLNSSEMENPINETPTNEKNVIEIEGASAKWSLACKRDTLSKINLNVTSGSITAIIGQVGSGKSSLLHAILRELPLTEGKLRVSGKIAYVSQEAWIFASSIRQNILFGRPMDRKRYEAVINVCQLDHDLAMFPDKDQTIIGEKGITLSGGQRARINLARAVYSEADIYLLDDPLSAVDTKVGRLIFQQCISEYLRGTTRILVTHQFQYLKNVSNITVLNNGSIEASGNFQELQNKDLDLMNVRQATCDLDDQIAEETTTTDLPRIESSEGQIQEQEAEELGEHRSFGRIAGKVYFSYFKAVNSWCFVIMMFVVSILNQVVASGGDFFVAIWVNVEEKLNRTVILGDRSDEFDRYWYIEIYGILILLTIIMVYVQVFVFYEMCMRASQRLHASMFSRIIRGTMHFFHTNPSGRILNRFSKDIGAVDRLLPISMLDVLTIGLLLVAVIIITTSVNQWLLIPTIVMGFIFYVFKEIFIKTSRSVKRLEGITRSPVVNHLSATLNGLTTIRAFGAERILTKEFDNHQDLHSSSWYIFFSCTRIFGYYLEFLCAIYVGIVVYSFLLVDLGENTGNIGLVVSQCILLSGMLQWGIMQTADMENQMTSVERIVEYTKIEEEKCLESGPGNKIQDGWPAEGQIEFRNVSLRYNPKKDPVLKNLNFLIHPKEKVGIVGRTGAGKSSLITSLFRLAHLEGEIYIDGLATSKMGLHDLRSKLSIIPQEPLLFAGSLRMNLDPFDEFRDEDLWRALTEVELKETIVKMEAGLQARVADGGGNFSVGQRQLLCLARAIVRKSRILVLDEATANVDPQTDDLIQKTIRRRFKDCTVLIIAHRLNTVMDCDKFIVMEAGSIMEIDHPFRLLEKKEGHLYEMVQQTGPEMAQILTRMSEKNYLESR